MKITDTEEHRLHPEEHGYKEFTPDTRYTHFGAKRAWQKCVMEDNVKLYYITIYGYEDYIYGELYIGYEFEIQMYDEITHNALNLTFLSGWDIDSVEKKAYSIYKNCGFEPYERSDG